MIDASAPTTPMRWIAAEDSTDGDGQPFTGTSAGFTQATSANRPTYRATGLLGRPAFDFGANNSGLFLETSGDVSDIWGAVSSTGVTIQIVFQGQSTGNDLGTLFTGDVDNGNRATWLMKMPARYSDLQSSILSREAASILQYTWNPTGSVETLWLNGHVVSTASGVRPAPVNNGSFRVGVSLLNTWWYSGLIGQITIDNSVLTNDQLGAWVRYWAAYYGQSGQTLVICTGDSRTDGNETGGPSYPTQLQTLLRTSYTVLNRGIAGWKVEDLRDHVPIDVRGCCSPLYQDVIVVVLIGVNDYGIASEQNAAQVLFDSALLPYELGGAKIVYLLEPDWNGDSGSETWRANYNGYIRQYFLQLNGRRNIQPVDTDPFIGVAGACTNTSYYVNTVHQNVAGAAIIAAYAQKGIAALSEGRQPIDTILSGIASGSTVVRANDASGNAIATTSNGQPIQVSSDGHVKATDEIGGSIATPLAKLDATVSSRSTYAGGAVASVTAPVTVAAGGIANPQNYDNTGQTTAIPVTEIPSATGSVPTQSSPALAGQAIEFAANYPVSQQFTVTNFDATNWTQIVLTIKANPADADTAAKIAVKVSNPSSADGLITLNGAAPSGGTSASDASLSVTTADSTVLGVTFSATARGSAIAPGSYFGELTVYKSGGKQSWLGVFDVTVDPTVRQNPTTS